MADSGVRELQKLNAYTIQVDDLSLWVSFVAYVKDMQRKTFANNMVIPQFVFRGQSDAKWDLMSSYERICANMPCNLDEEALKDKERNLINSFKCLSSGMVDNSLEDCDILALMQHYGIPTRLLDFSYAPLIALYFAAQKTHDSKTYEPEKFAVWMISLNATNSYYNKEAIYDSIKQQLASGGKEGQKIHVALPGSTRMHNRQRIISDRALLAKVLEGDAVGCAMISYDSLTPNMRMRAQRGLFLASTKLEESFMNSFYEWHGIADKQFTPINDGLSKLFNGVKFVNDEIAAGVAFKFEFPSELRENVTGYLELANVRPSVLFPDLGGVAEEIKHELSDGML